MFDAMDWAVGTGLTAAVSYSVTQLSAEFTRNRSMLLGAAETSSGLSREDLWEKLGENRELVPLATRILLVAAQRRDEDVVRTLGSVLGQCFAMPELLDEAEITVTIIESLSPLQIHLLRVLAVPAPGFVRWFKRDLLETAQIPNGVGDFCINSLVQMGLAQSELTNSQRRTLSQQPEFSITETGRTILQVLRDSRINSTPS